MTHATTRARWRAEILRLEAMTCRPGEHQRALDALDAVFTALDIAEARVAVVETAAKSVAHFDVPEESLDDDRLSIV